jgi:hypothetical protein
MKVNDFGVDDFMTMWVGGESEYEWSYEDIGQRLLELLRVLIQCNASGGELLVIVKVMGVHVLYYEKGFKQWVRQMQGLRI